MTWNDGFDLQADYLHHLPNYMHGFRSGWLDSAMELRLVTALHSILPNYSMGYGDGQRQHKAAHNY